MVKREIPIRNSTTLPVEHSILNLDTTWEMADLKKEVKKEFNLPNSKFVLFIRVKKKWYFLDPKKKLSDYDLKADKLEIDVKRDVSLSKFQSYFRDLQSKYSDEMIMPYGILKVDQTEEEETRSRLTQIVKQFVLDSLKNPSEASFSIPSRSGDNIGYDEESEYVLLGRQKIERAFRSLSSVKSFYQLSRLMVILDEILSRDIHATKRDIFYQDVNAFEGQSTSDSLIEDLSALLQVTRPSLNVSASSKGVVIGKLQFEEKGDFIDCTKIGTGKSIAPMVEEISNIQSDAEMVLVIEKDAVFNRLAEDQFYDYIPSIIVTAKGQPDMATRMFLKKIDEELKLPILAIMDADVYGIEIMRVYTVGSKSLSFEASNLAVPNMKWLGLLPSDLQDDSGFHIPSSTHIKLTKNDENKIKLMLEEEFVRRKPKWRKQLETLQSLGVKAEIQALNARDPQFITNHYLPDKLETSNFI